MRRYRGARDLIRQRRDRLPSGEPLGTLRTVIAERTKHNPLANTCRASLPSPLARRGAGGRVVCAGIMLVAMLPLGGCASLRAAGQARRSLDDWLSRDQASQDWAGDYEAAERHAKATNMPMVLSFSESDFTMQDATLAVLRDERVSSRLAGCARGTLVRSFEPDRRYAEQFGVTRAPSLILVHRDGTYHAYTGVMSPEALVAFLEASRPPGSVVAWNPLIPRSYEYDWIPDLDVATQRSREGRTPMIVVYDRHLSRDWRELAPLLTSREVGIRIDGFVHCRVRLLPQTGDAFITPFGALRLPALVVVNPDGSFTPLEQPTTAGAIARLVDQQVTTGSVSSASTASPVGDPGIMQRIATED